MARTHQDSSSNAARFTGSFSASVPAPADAVFALVTDVARLPEWNRAVTRVVEAPAALEPGAEWVVTVKPAGWPSWPSRSRVREIDPAHGVFAYRSQTDDGNPSYADCRRTGSCADPGTSPRAGLAVVVATWFGVSSADVRRPGRSARTAWSVRGGSG
ncbi:SRPBCC family protein [Streptodolium elevatio]|uniref:SRPBCC family protein n=1 Tax=Streptodolium elevatio TaxID=3157996 RepID=A0ABV3DGN4_9ACTN